MPAVTPPPSLARQVAVARLRVTDLSRRLAAAERAEPGVPPAYLREDPAAARRALERLEVLEAEERGRDGRRGSAVREEVDRADR
ncbi:MAG: hypothetical protein HY721_16340 [Planctomycetes bacterium]|nr:hypothetical protein [Planctomycetota bacterium]